MPSMLGKSQPRQKERKVLDLLRGGKQLVCTHIMYLIHISAISMKIKNPATL